MPLMMRSSSTPSALTFSVSIDLPSRMIVIESAICSISLSLWEMMMEVMPRPFRPSIRSSRCWESDFVQRRRGLVQDEELDRLVQRLGDFHQLLLADADFLDGGVRVLAQPHPGQQFGGAGPGLGPVDHAALGGLVAQEDVLRDGQFRDQREFLVDDHDAGVLAGPDVLELLDLVLVDDVAGVAAVRVDAREHLHQRGFAGAVLTADGVDLAGLHPQAHLGQVL